MCFAPTIRHCSPPVTSHLSLSLSFSLCLSIAPHSRSRYHPGGAGGGPHPRDLPENQYSYRPPPRPHPTIQPASQPATPCPTYFPRYAPPYTILECRFPFWVRSTEPRQPSSLAPTHSPPRSFACFSFHHSHPRKHRPPSRSSSSCHYPSCFSLLASSPSVSPTPARHRSLSLPPLSSPTVPRHAARFSRFPWAGVQTRPTTPIGQTILKRPGPGKHKKKMRRREREQRMNPERKRDRLRNRERKKKARREGRGAEGSERKLASRSYQVNLRESEGNWRPANCSEAERGACPIFTGPSKSNLPTNTVVSEQWRSYHDPLDDSTLPGTPSGP